MFNFMRLPPLRRLMLMKAITGGGSWSTISGNPVSFTARNAPLKQLKVAFSPKQDLHGYDSPWPAGGGANKYGGSVLKSSLLAVTGAAEGSDSNGSFVNIPASTALNDVALFDGFAENTQYTIILKFLPTGAAVANVRVYYTDNTYQGFSSSADGAVATVSYTTTAGKTVAAIKLGYWYTTTSKIYYDDCGIFVGANQLFSPYANECPILGWDSLTVYHSGADTSNPQTISITLGSTIYSGTVDVVTGVVTVTMASVDLGTLTWYRNGTYPIFYAVLTNSKTESGQISTGAMSSQYAIENVAWYQLSDNHMVLFKGLQTAGVNSICVRDDRFPDADSFSAAMNGVQLVYELAEPLTIQLTPQEVESLAGDNTLWSDANQPLTITYRSN